ncbi:16S rRNA (cytosine(1402)-N(4))-methyltransferase RsmH [Acuticoccus sp. I52.16.1]|uniref:16S rRNA (cytosine(1402)-N(4))-methyltransferase RsmH n=1 Tax=Acuticoccus sp. I52.16.1 TaxID=2928472 RepID=UPI001FD00D22|nr:16S rRNA (cytosine(1402)-N(4))-methyltransferase RsmH [Acuticoccus sp. I52.16.1]UOM33606.1 16S rRNA (cytosine(1402)-N(4))-methyltransferase RsmH [Acuticoccus sp. I52.16.1]
MTADRESAPSAHIPVMLAEVMAELAPKPGERIVDATFGGGGYTRAILGAGAQVIGIDRDPDAVARGRAITEPGFTMVEGTFGAMDTHLAALGLETVDGVVLDVGVSSFQLDQAERGFSFRFDGPLDMRMGADGPTAADICNRADVSDLAHLLRTFGEERHAGRVARAIVAARPLASTAELAAVCERALKPGPGIHPATRTFQALRIAVNDELNELARGLAAAERILSNGGRLVVVAFHSLEDRIVKRFLAERAGAGGGSRHMPVVSGPAASFAPSAKRALSAGEAEAARNPRARSAKLRAATRTDAPALPLDLTALVPNVRLKGI